MRARHRSPISVGVGHHVNPSEIHHLESGASSTGGLGRRLPKRSQLVEGTLTLPVPRGENQTPRFCSHGQLEFPSGRGRLNSPPQWRRNAALRSVPTEC